VVPTPLSPVKISLCVHKPSANAKKGLGMLSLIATVLVLAFLVYVVWPWLWHIAMTLALILFVYLAWPWFLQKPWEDLLSWLQQIHVPQIASATNAPSGRLYVSRQRTGESRIHFEELGQEKYPRPYPKPILVDRWRGHDVFWWKGECWVLRHNEEPYRFLCVAHGRLQWCWQVRPNACAVPCKSPDTGEYGWCWRNEVSYRNDS
jgi:hypothetical protein